MYTLQKAAALLGKSQKTVRRWMRNCGLAGNRLDTDRVRIYISQDDLFTLIEYYENKLPKHAKQKRSQKGENSATKTEEHFCSLIDAASLLGVTHDTIKKWVRQHNLETRIIATDKVRSWVKREDVVMLANLHGRKLAQKSDIDLVIEEEEHNSNEEINNELCSTQDIMHLLNASYSSVKRWLRQHNIEKKLITTDRPRVYVGRNDVLMLARLHNRRIVANMEPVDEAEELKELRGEVKRLASEIEDIKHDLRLYVKNSIYIG